MKSAENGNGHNVCQTKASGSKRLESATKQLGEWGQDKQGASFIAHESRSPDRGMPLIPGTFPAHKSLRSLLIRGSQHAYAPNNLQHFEALYKFYDAATTEQQNDISNTFLTQLAETRD